MNSGIENLIGSASYELASDEACQTKAQHKAGAIAQQAKRNNHTPNMRPGPAQKPGPAEAWARTRGCDEWAGAVRGPQGLRAVLAYYSKCVTRILKRIEFV